MVRRLSMRAVDPLLCTSPIDQDFPPRDLPNPGTTAACLLVEGQGDYRKASTGFQELGGCHQLARRRVGYQTLQVGHQTLSQGERERRRRFPLQVYLLYRRYAQLGG